MLKLLDSLKNTALGAGRDSHPLAHPKEAEAVFNELRGGEPANALDEITHWLESVAAADDIKPERRFEIIKRLDETGQPHRIKLARDFATLARQSKFQEGKLWQANHDFWLRCAEAYDNLIRRIEAREKGTDALKNHAAMIAVRALRASAMRLKWLYVHYGPIPGEVWAALSRAYQFAEVRKLQLGQLIVYPGMAGDASPEGEFTRALVLAASAPDALSPGELDIAERLIAHCAAKFRVAAQPQPDSTYWFDLASPRQPLRLAAPPEQLTPGLRFFATTAGHADMQALLTKIDQSNGELPRGLDLGGTPDVRLVREVLKHLVLNWAPKPPVRKNERRRIQGRMRVAYGFAQLVSLMQGGNGGVDFVLDAAPLETESWLVENLSVGGFGACVPDIKGDWLKIGSLLAVQPDNAAATGGPWDLAIIRRLARDGEAQSKGQASAGVQVLARQAVTVELRPQHGAWSTGTQSVQGIYMLDSSEPGAALLAMPPGLYMPGEQLVTMVAGRQHLLFPIGVTERGDDYDMIRFRDMVQEN